MWLRSEGHSTSDREQSSRAGSGGDVSGLDAGSNGDNSGPELSVPASTFSQLPIPSQRDSPSPKGSSGK